jgi:hypothetical protein
MKAEMILSAKGNTVITTRSETTSVRIRNKMFGALVVNGDGVGIGRHHGTSSATSSSTEIMTRKGITSGPTADVGTLMGLVTKRRCRYIPAKKDRVLSGIISIGTLLKSRLEQVKREANQLRDYIARG